MLQKIWVILGNILKIMFMISLGVSLNIQAPKKDQIITSKEYLLLTIQILRVIKEQNQDGGSKFIFTNPRTSSKPKKKF